MEGDVPPRRPGRRDPDRRCRIADAAVEVIAERGIGGLTHRAVAAKADVPLGSTTYYFADLDQLLEAALSRAAHRHVTDLRAWADRLPADCDLVAMLADWADELTGPQRRRLIVDMELAQAALRRPGLRPLRQAAVAEICAVISRFTDSLTAYALHATMAGLLADALTTPLDRAHTEAVLRRVLEGGTDRA
jgi:DNA-binding transcriptional regulator YbjK